MCTYFRCCIGYLYTSTTMITNNNDSGNDNDNNTKKGPTFEEREVWFWKSQIYSTYCSDEFRGLYHAPTLNTGSVQLAVCLSIMIVYFECCHILKRLFFLKIQHKDHNELNTISILVRCNLFPKRKFYLILDVEFYPSLVGSCVAMATQTLYWACFKSRFWKLTDEVFQFWHVNNNIHVIMKQ